VLRRALGACLLFVAACGSGETTPVERADVAPQQAPDVELPAPLTTEASGPTSTVPPSDGGVTEQAASPALPAPIEPSRPEPWTLEPYRGFGAWLDAYDWSVSFARSPEHVIGLEDIDRMAAEGVQTIYIQASRWNSPEDILEPQRLQGIIDRAHGHGMAVVAWYLPTLVDPETDLRRMIAIASMDFDGFGVDIEARDVEDVAERNRRLLDISARLEAALEGRPLAAIVMEPVIMEDVNPQFWPDYPWMGLAEHYDVWLPMSYWTNRRGAWRHSHTYTAENIARIRERIGQPDAPVHTIGGIGDKTTVGDLHGMVVAAVEQRAIGGSIYDYRTTDPAFWDVLRAFRAE
tara:strand:+ start:354 stop:1397 length:1044 start_codon:yes stop_codon:yes gene_type:complete